MASLPLAWNNGFLIAQENLSLYVGSSRFFGRERTRSCSISNNNFGPVSSPFYLLSNHCRNPYHRLSCSNKIRVVGNEKIDIDGQLVRGGKNHGKRRRFSLRLRPRIRLLSRRLKRASIRSMLEAIGTFLRKNVKRVTFSTSVSVVLGLCFLFLKITAMPTPKVAPYSDLIMSLQNGSVTKVLFEEGTRRIYYNTKLWNDKDTKTVVDTVSSSSENVLDNDSSKDVSRNDVDGKNASPAWEFSTRKIDHDESYLLSLMRERGISYGSAPQSVLVSMRSMLITVLTLWIPLTPLMWILYRQLSAANSPAKKRRPTNQLVCFEDVEGVDAAKVELMEVCCLTPKKWTSQELKVLIVSIYHIVIHVKKRKLWAILCEDTYSEVFLLQYLSSSYNLE